MTSHVVVEALAAAVEAFGRASANAFRASVDSACALGSVWAATTAATTATAHASVLAIFWSFDAQGKNCSVRP